MSISLEDISAQLPKEDISDYRGLNQTLFNQLNKTCIVIDDDPTGNQTVYDIPLLAEWDLDTIIQEFKNETPVFFLLTNSRSLSKEKSSEIYQKISEIIQNASVITGRNYTIISRSDSTLRGHFPSEINAIKKAGDFQDAITVFIPVMLEGGRVTANDIHYILEKGQLTPVNETVFSQDHTFGYSTANLKEYIEEKTEGQVNASDLFSLSIENIRMLDAETLCKQIKILKPKTYCIINALNYNDLDKATYALLLAEKQGKKILYRTSSSFVPSYIGLKSRNLLSSELLVNKEEKTGGLTIVGSYVPKSSTQLQYALKHYRKEAILEITVENILNEQADSYIKSVVFQIDKQLANGNDVIVYTSRKLITGASDNTNINIAESVSMALVALVNSMTIKPRYLLAKGGITSHDLAVKGLSMKRSKVLGQIEYGIPVWEMGAETKFPKLPYIVFPGNVGDDKSLYILTKKLAYNEDTN